MSQKHYKLHKHPEILCDSRLTAEEINAALKAIERLLFHPNRRAVASDYEVGFIKSTNSQWMRQKRGQKNWRNILEVQEIDKTIIVHAVLFKDDEIYETVVEKLYLERR